MWRIGAPFWAWALSSMFLGLGFAFFSGAVEAWLVDALAASGFKGKLESVLAKGEIVEGAAMLAGSIAGGLLAQMTNLGAPYVVRALLLVATFALAFLAMRDLGFTPVRGKHPVEEVKKVLASSIEHGLGNRPVRWIMLEAPFSMGVSVYGFYAMQPYLMQLYGDPRAYGIAGVSAAIVGGAQIAGGLLAPHAGRLFRRRTSVVLACVIASSLTLALIGLVPGFWGAISLLVLWGLMFAIILPVRQAYLNGLISSENRATVLSFDSLLGSAGGVVIQPVLGRTADVFGYPASYLAGATLQALAVPFIGLARRERAAADAIEK
jgi:MFS family permease